MVMIFFFVLNGNILTQSLALALYIKVVKKSIPFYTKEY